MITLKRSIAIAGLTISLAIAPPIGSAFSEPTLSRRQVQNFNTRFRPGMTRREVEQMMGRSNRGDASVDGYRVNNQDSTYLGIIYDSSGRASTYTFYTPKPKRNIFGF